MMVIPDACSSAFFLPDPRVSVLTPELAFLALEDKEPLSFKLSFFLWLLPGGEKANLIFLFGAIFSSS